MPKRETVLVANVYGSGNRKPDAVARWLKHHGYTVAIICELVHVKDALRKIGRLFFSPDDTPTDVAVLVARGTIREFVYKRLSRFIKRPGKANPRLWRDRHMVRVRVWGRVYYSIHANALIANRDGEWLRNEGAKVWRDAMSKLYDQIKADLDKGYRVRIGGDFNFFDAEPYVQWSPADFFSDLGLNWFSDGRVMYFAYGSKDNVDVLISWTLLDTAPGADAHRVIKAVLRKKTREELRKPRR